jgi:hypothetical protein
MSSTIGFKNPVNRVASALLVVSLAMAALVARKLDEMRPNAVLDEVLYLQSPRVLKFMSLGYTGLAASIYWTRAVQYYGEKNVLKAKRFDLLPKLLNLTVDLDPHLIPAYSFGSIFLAQQPPQGAGMPDKAVEFVERGIRDNPADWRLYYNLGFIHYLERHDYKAAADAFERGSKVPGASPGIKTMAASMEQRAGNTDTARLLWTSIYESWDDPNVRRNALMRLVALRVDDDVIHLDKMVQDYVKATGRAPANWQALIVLGWLRGVPLDPSGAPYELQPGGRVVVSDVSKFPFIEHGIPAGVKRNDFIGPEADKVLQKPGVAPK